MSWLVKAGWCAAHIGWAAAAAAAAAPDAAAAAAGRNGKAGRWGLYPVNRILVRPYMGKGLLLSLATAKSYLLFPNTPSSGGPRIKKIPPLSS
jgi:hypothetical protein